MKEGIKFLLRLAAGIAAFQLTGLPGTKGAMFAVGLLIGLAGATAVIIFTAADCRGRGTR